MKSTLNWSLRLVFILLFFFNSAEAQVPDRFERKPKDEKQPIDPPQDESVEDNAQQVEEESIDAEEQEVKAKRTDKSETPNSTSASKNKKGFDPDNLRYGGALGMTFGNFTYILLNPRVGYYFNDKLFAGIGFTYIYSSDNRASTVVFNNGKALEQSIYGINPFVNYEVFAGIGVGAEFDLVNADLPRLNPFTGEITIQRDWIPHLFVGASYYPKDQGGFFGIYWNVLDDGSSFYANPEIRFGFLF